MQSSFRAAAPVGQTPAISPIRFLLSVVALVMALPFIALAIVPIMLMLIPVAFVVLPFLVFAFAPQAHELRRAHVTPGVVLLPAVSRAAAR